MCVERSRKCVQHDLLSISPPVQRIKTGGLLLSTQKKTMKDLFQLATDYNPAEHRGVYFAQPKLDGVRAIYHAGSLYTRSGRALPENPIAAELAAGTPAEIYLDGELYSPDLTFPAIAGKVRSGDLTGLSLHVFDCFMPTSTLDYSQRLDIAAAVIAGSQYARIIPTCREKLATVPSIRRAMEAYTRQGYEGLILRADTPWRPGRTGSLLKLKPTTDREFEIRDLIRTTGSRLSLLLSTAAGQTFRCAVGMTAEERAELWDDRAAVIGGQATVEYQELTARGVPRFPRLVEIRNYE